MMYRISLFINVTLSLVFIALGVITILPTGSIQSATVFVFVFLLFAYSIFLLFDFVCYRILSVNKEKLPLAPWIKSYSKIIFVFSILALLCLVFMTVAAAYAFFEDVRHFPERQRPFYIGLLVLMLLSAITYIINAAGYFRSLKENKIILREYINDIGSSLNR